MGTMLRVLPVLPVLVVTGALAFTMGASRGTTARAAAPQVNACGCYKDSAGTCYCGKKAGKCVCPGECEPHGCDEKRAREIEKEVQAETKRAREAEKKQRDDAAEKERKAAAPPPDEEGESDSDAPGAGGNQKAGGGDQDEASDGKAKKSKKSKKSKKAKDGKGEE